ncbi:outer membrane protein assembly factor BamA [Sphingomonas panacisoli]|uniref:Outer membrane protein assembly factor BamA n=1 Tax=Sphingomonas panacisoli TaxID=1813879 RepID=A0A5B8LGY2_9SPHN|nr:outer membrane protein assembly factor BamA [Sphingomonas panacisoli]QDZ07517.1 outer membrane protein assembly factor BamA [Sphingomonas panacisoli]
MVKLIKVTTFGTRAAATLLAGTMLSGVPLAAAQTAPKPAAPAAAAPQATSAPAAVAPAPQRVIKSLRVEGSQRIEPETVLSYTKLRTGQAYSNETLDQALRDLLASDLFADVSIAGVETGDITIRIRENPIINRVLLEGNSTLKSDKITKEIKLAPRQIFTRTAVRQDVARIIELYRRQGRFAARIEPKMVSLDQNRVDIVFEISEGPKSKVRAINILGNTVFSDAKLREQMVTKQASITRFFSSNTSYDQDRLAYDQQKLRQFYLTQGYADFRVTSAVAELTPDKKDFIITYVVEEGPRYKFGDVTVDSDIRDFDNNKLAATLPVKKGAWFDAKKVEDSVTSLNETAGLFGYAFTDVSPDYQRDGDNLVMSVNFHIAEAKRTYVERIEVTGNRNTQDKVVRREIRMSEGDAFNSFSIKRSQDRINSLGFFQDKFEIKNEQGSAPDRVILNANVEEKATGELSLSAGYSSLERFIIQAGITQRNFRGKGQELRANVDYSVYSKSIQLGFTEPYLFDKNIALGVDVFRRDYNSFNYLGDQRQTTYSQVSTGFQARVGIPLTEYWSLSARYGLTFDQVGLDKNTYFKDTNGDGTPDTCNIVVAGRYLCEAIGNRVTSALGYSLVYNSLNGGLRPTAGQRLVFSQDFAGLGGDVRYIRTRFEGSKYWNLGKGFIFSVNGEAGYIKALEKSKGPGIDPVRITDRFYLGEPQIRGFDIRGVGPRVQRINYIQDDQGNQILQPDKQQIIDDALGGRAYYLVRFEIEPPLSGGARELGLRPSIFMDVGAVFGIKRPLPTATFPTHVDPTTGKTIVDPLITPITDSSGRPLYTYTDPNGLGQVTTCPAGLPDSTGACNGVTPNSAQVSTVSPFLERFLGDSPKPRLSIGFGVNWNSPFGPLRIDIAKALLHQKGDDTKLVTFNVGTQF